jgi:hypothetical protein
MSYYIGQRETDKKILTPEYGAIKFKILSSCVPCVAALYVKQKQKAYLIAQNTRQRIKNHSRRECFLILYFIYIVKFSQIDKTSYF